MIKALQTKRAALISSQEQLVGQINRVGGAISVIDELIAEQCAPLSIHDILQEEYERRQTLAPEMLPVSKFAPCEGCPESMDCHQALSGASDGDAA